MSILLLPFGADGSTYVDANGNPISGYKCFVYAANSATKATIYQDAAGGAQHSNPITMNTKGQVANSSAVVKPIFVTSGATYDVVVAPANDTDPPASPIMTLEDLQPINDTSVSIDQWIAGNTPTFIGATSFSLVGDQTSTYHIGRRIKTQNTAGTIYSTITNSVYGALTTVTVVNDSGSLDSGLSAVWYGLLSASNSAVPGVKISGSNWTHQGTVTMSGKSVIDANASVAAHATTSDIWSAGNYVTLTGSAVTFTDFADAPQAGAEVELYCNDAHTFTNNSNLVIDGAANFTAAAGDRIRVRARSTTVFDLTPIRRSGTPLVNVPVVSNALSIIKCGGVNLSQGATLYLRPVGQLGNNTVEANTRIQIRQATTISELRAVLSAAVPGGQTITFTLRKNGADTSCTFVISAGATTGSDTSNSVDFDTGDWLAIKAVTSAAFGTTNDVNVTAVCKIPNSSYAASVVGFGNLGFGVNGYLGEPGGTQFGVGTESHGQVPLRKCVIARFYGTDQTGGAMNMFLRRNGSSISPALNGPITDGADYVSGQADVDAHVFGTNDLLTILNNNGVVSAAGTLVFFNEANPYDIYAPTFFASQGQTQGTTVYMGGWNASSASATEADVNIPMPACVARNLRVHSSAAPPAGQTCIITVRKNGVDTALTATITESGTTFSDTSNTVTFAAGDLLSIKSVSSATAGTLSYTASLELTTS